MLRKLAGYGTGLIALFIVVNSASNAGSLITAGATGLSKVTGTLQGRTV